MFVSKLMEVASRKQAELGRRLTQIEISEETGISPNTIGRWMSKHPMGRIEAPVVLPLMRFFDCTLDDLVEVKYVPRGRKK